MSWDWDDASRAFSLLRVLVWLAVLPLSYAFSWLESVTFVALASIYANLASDYASYRADSNRKIERRLDVIIGKLSELEDTIRQGGGPATPGD